ncbi:MAG: type I 3-dehydroquinate dehydratase [Luteolibacter sp.]
MSDAIFNFPESSPKVVGSFGDPLSLRTSSPAQLGNECDIAEIRLDIFHDEFKEKGAALWQHISSFPLLFTARRHSEGSPVDLTPDERTALLRNCLGDAVIVDIEVSSIPEMHDLISEMNERGVRWIASFHDFAKLPDAKTLAAAASRARDAGAAVFKAAAQLNTMDDLTALAHFQISDQGIPVSTMGMGILAPTSRLLCAQAGSVLNYGFIGTKATAPGQWSAKQLRDGIRTLNSIPKT